MFTLIKVLPGYYFFWKICQIFGLLWKLLFVFQKMYSETFTTSWADSKKIHYAVEAQAMLVVRGIYNSHLQMEIYWIVTKVKLSPKGFDL